jgi:beta-lactamase class A
MNPYRRKKKSKRALWILLLAAILLALGFWLFRQGESKESEQNNSPSQQEEQEQKPPLVDLQPVVDSWVAKQSAEYGIVVYDPANQQAVASHNPDEKYFAASLYKIFVAYLALVDFQTGKQDPDEVLTGGFTRKECVDKMIRESHSPCGETMMADMGQETLRQRVQAMGINNTTFAGITTTAQDSALILQRILEGKELSAENTAFLKDAMRVQDQKFRNGLAKGAPEATWETKVGWNEDDNYHDVGIMTLPNGRQYIVAILSQGQGKSAVVADFAATIYSVLN